MTRRLAAAVVAAAVVLGACQQPPAATPRPTAGSGPVVADGPGWRGVSVDGPVPAPGTCHYGGSSTTPLPDPSCTPGAVDAAVTQSTLAQTLCRSGGYTASVRPPQAVTDAYKKLARAAYSSTGSSASDELDHLVPLGLGGASSAQNLWPEPNVGDPRQYDRRATGGANAKDGVESRLNRAVCSGEVTLAAAQAAVATRWDTAETVLGVAP
ncbi:MAG: hypothetical protein ABIW80_03155 [Lapillicoccus sp.]